METCATVNKLLPSSTCTNVQELNITFASSESSIMLRIAPDTLHPVNDEWSKLTTEPFALTMEFACPQSIEMLHTVSCEQPSFERHEIVPLVEKVRPPRGAPCSWNVQGKKSTQRFKGNDRTAVKFSLILTISQSKISINQAVSVKFDDVSFGQGITAGYSIDLMSVEMFPGIGNGSETCENRYSQS